MKFNINIYTDIGVRIYTHMYVRIFIYIFLAANNACNDC